MKEIRITKNEDSYLPKLYSEGWSLVAINDFKFYLEREVKKTRKEKKAERTIEYTKFHDLYPKKSGITSDSVIRKINELEKDGSYQKVIEGVERYLKMIKVENIVPKFILNAETFLNQRRWQDPFDTMESRIPIAEAWLLPIIKDLNELETKEVIRMKKEWELKQKKDITPGIMQNIIKRVKGQD